MDGGTWGGGDGGGRRGCVNERFLFFFTCVDLRAFFERLDYTG